MEEFKIGDFVLVRDTGEDIWVPYQYVTTKNGKVWFSDGTWLEEGRFDMIPLSYENDYLVGTNKIPAKPWEPEPGELVAVKDEEEDFWRPLIFIGIGTDGKYLCGWAVDTEADKAATFDQCEPLYRHFNIPKRPEDA